MRVLFGFTGGRGHVEPLVPLATAAREAGHTVAFAGRPSILPAVEALGFEAFPAEAEHETPPRRIALQPVDLEREERDFRGWFADRIARDRATRVRSIAGEWRADLVVCEETDFGSMIAAERLGLPYASVAVLAASSFTRPEIAGEPLNAVRLENGLPSDPELEMLGRHLVLSPFPPSYREPSFPTERSFRSSGPPPPPSKRDGATTVYFTLGTVFNLECGDLFARVLDGLRELPFEVVATVGPHVDPAEFGPLPDRFHLAEYVPQSDVLPRADVVVSHGGSGSVLGALAHGLPQVLIPMGADQPLNGKRCEELGLARVLDPIAATPESVRDAVSTVLTDETYRAAAERMRDEIAALPGPDDAVTLLERLASG
ncbi:MAG TPA: glycosyltransferase [Gaiellaceae bacterium]|nr:glycosyltransferase [Gaiellaceae bacterium]